MTISGDSANSDVCSLFSDGDVVPTATLAAAPQQVGNGLLLTYSSARRSDTSVVTWSVYLHCGEATLAAPNGVTTSLTTDVILVLESSAACFPVPSVLPPSTASCPPLTVNGTTIDISTIGTVVLPGLNAGMQVNLCSAVSACGGSFTSFISSITSNLTNCVSFGVFSQMAMAPQVVSWSRTRTRAA
jgi:hypothetical protein